MKRIASGTQVASIPTFPADTGTPGYFADAATTPSATPTAITPKWVTSLQEAVCQTIEDSGDALSDDMDQFKNVVAGVHGIKAHATTTGSVTTPKTRVVVASASGTASGATSLVGASNSALASGAKSSVLASSLGTASGEESAVIASQGNSFASARNSAVIAANQGLATAANTFIGGGTTPQATAARAATIGGASSAATAEDAGTFVGDNPTASGLKAVAIGGHDLTASGENAAAVGGDTNVAAAAESFVGGGNSHDIQSGATRAAAVGGNNHTISGARGIALGGDSHTLTSADSLAGGGSNNIVAATKGFVIGGTGNDVQSGAAMSGILASDTCMVQSDSSKPNKVLIASLAATLANDGNPSGGGADGYCLAGGHTNDPVSGAANVDVTWLLSSKHGTLALDNTTLISGADYAEYFPNVTEGIIPPGSLVARQGKRVRLARPGDRVLGVVSAAPSVVGNAAGLSWSGAKLRDEWGAIVYEEREVCRFETTDDEGVVYRYQGLVTKCPVKIPADAERWMSRDPVRNPAFDPSQAYSPRQARPDQWTCVALLGQVRVRIGPDVEEGDYLTPGLDGCAVGTLARPDGRPVEVMEITTPYNPATGYGVALCLVG